MNPVPVMQLVEVIRGLATSDETTAGAVKQTTFEHGKITFNPQTGKVEVTVHGKVVPAGI